MKKEKFFVARPNGYEQVEGYIIDGVGYHKLNSGRWISTDLETGLYYVIAPTLKECKATVRTKWDRISTIKKSIAYQKMYGARIRELAEYKEKHHESDL